MSAGKLAHASGAHMMSIHFQRVSRALGALLLATTALTAPAEVAERAVTGECVIAPHRSIELASAVPGILAAVNFERTELVRAGEAVAELDSAVERAELRLARARAAMSAEIQLSNASLDFDRLNEQRLTALHASQSVAVLERDRAQRDAALSGWKVRRAEEQRRLRELELDRARAVLERRTVRSPIEGFVVRRHRSAGEYVEDEPILTIAQLDPLRIEAVLALEHFGQVSPGTSALVTLETGSAVTHEAQVSLVDRVADAASGTFGVRLELANPEYKIPAGIKCAVAIAVAAPAQPRAPAAGAGEWLPHEGLESIEGLDEGTDEPREPVTPERARRPVEPARPELELPPVPKAPPAGGIMVRSEVPALDEALCATVGPIDEPRRAARVLESLSALDPAAALEERQLAETTGYVVLAARQSSAAETRTLVARLRAAGLDEVAVVPAVGGGTRVSLGLFKAQAEAAQHIEALRAHDVAAEWQARKSVRPTWWVTLSGPLQRPVLLNAIGASVPTDCPDTPLFAES